LAQGLVGEPFTLRGIMRRKLSGRGALMAMTSSKSTMTCGCPVTAFQKMISGKYKLRIMWDLKGGPLRYGEIRSGLLRGATGTQEIAPRVLSRELKALAHTGLIDRKDYRVVPPKVEYRLTRKGQSFIPIIAAIRKWGTRHLNRAGNGVEGDRMAAE
jgi:DNA-binding HxlR family transcriptional regulator